MILCRICRCSFHIEDSVHSVEKKMLQLFGHEGYIVKAACPNCGAENTKLIDKEDTSE